MMINVKNYGAVGDGVANDHEAIQKAFFAGERDVFIPKGIYAVDKPLMIPSHRHILADRKARIVFVAKKMLSQNEFLLTNADVEDGNEDITVEGGVWDGGFGREYNKKSSDIFEINSASGTCLNFVGVKNLKLLDITVANPVGYYTRLSRVRNFEIKNICFSSEKQGPNQDGLHFGGYVRDGKVENVRAVTKGQTNDDLIAINADDSIVRQENRGIACGPIENIVIRNVYAEDCHTAVRIASVTSAIRNITIENLYAGVRCFGINMDGNRYCRTPLFIENSAPHGVGNISGVRIENCTLFFSENARNPLALIDVEEHCSNFEIVGFSRPEKKDRFFERPTLLARNLVSEKVTAGGKTSEITEKSQEIRVNGDVSYIRLDSDYLDGRLN